MLILLLQVTFNSTLNLEEILLKLLILSKLCINKYLKL